MASSPTGAPTEPADGPSSSVYPSVFFAGVVLYGLSAVAGIAYSIHSHRQLPPLLPSPLTEAERYLEQGDLRRAAQQFRMAASIDRSDYATPRRLATILKAAGDASGQVDQYERARDLKHGDPLAHRLLGWAYYNNRRYDEADAAFLSASRLDPRDTDAHLGRANVWLDRDRPVEAETALRLALQLEGRNAAANNLLGIALDMQGRRAEAIRAFEEAVRLDPSPTFVRNLQRARAPLPPKGADSP